MLVGHKLAIVPQTVSVSVTTIYIGRKYNKGFLKFDLPGGSDGKGSACNAGDLGSIPGSGKSRGEGNGNPLHYSCLENTVDSVHCSNSLLGSLNDIVHEKFFTGQSLAQISA